jgi:aspartate/methionine/tyrosine aminotransferase
MSVFRLKEFFSGAAARSSCLNLSSSFAEPLTMAELISLEPSLPERLATLSLNYPAADGSEALRARIASYVGAAPEEVIVTNGADEALLLVYTALIRPSDRVVVQTPAYEPLLALARRAGAEVVTWQGHEAGGWRPSLEELEQHLRTPTRLVVVNFPHNPTGFTPDRVYSERLRHMVLGAGVILVVDEVYNGLPGGSRNPSAATLDGPCIGISGMSKVFGMPGVRIGWICTRDRKLIKAVQEARSFMNSFVSALSEVAAEAALAHADAIIERNSRIASEGREHLEAFLARAGDHFSAVMPEAGVNAFVRWHGEGSTDDLSKWALSEAGLLLAPSSYFDAGSSHVRIGFGRSFIAQGLSDLDQLTRASSTQVARP